MKQIKEGDINIGITKLTDKKIITISHERKNGLVYGRGKVRMLRRKNDTKLKRQIR